MRDLPDPPADEKAARLAAANAKRSASLRARYEKNPELREAVRARARSINSTQEMRKKISDATRQAMARPDVQEKLRENSSPERKSLISRRTREALAAPEIRQRISDRTREAMARPDVQARVAQGKAAAAQKKQAEGEKLSGELAALRAVRAGSSARTRQMFLVELAASPDGDAR